MLSVVKPSDDFTGWIGDGEGVLAVGAMLGVLVG